MRKIEDVKLVAVLVPEGVDQRVVRRALAVGLRQQQLTARSRGEQYLVVGDSDEDADNRIELAQQAISVPGEVFRLDGDDFVRELRKIIFRSVLPGRM